VNAHATENGSFRGRFLGARRAAAFDTIAADSLGGQRGAGGRDADAARHAR